MRVHLPHADGPRDVVVHVTDPDATVADLGAAIHPDRPVGPLVIDGVRVAPATPLDRAPIADGAAVTPAGVPDDPGPDEPGPAVVPVVSLTVTTGIDAGRTVVLGPGVHRVGRPVTRSGPAADRTDPDVTIDDPTVSADHARLVITEDGRCRVEDLGSTNGTWIHDGPDEPVRRCAGPTGVTHGSAVVLGSVRLEVGGPPPPPRPRAVPVPGARRVPFHRRPRPAVPAPRPPLDPPPPPDPPPAVTPVGVLGVVASLGVGVTMVVVLGSLTYALFALLGPALMVANAADSRRRRRRSRRRGDRRRRRQLQELAADLADNRAAERRRRRHVLPGPATAATVAAASAPTCWERRPHHLDAFAVSAGRGRAPWPHPVAGDPSTWADDVRELVERTPPPDHVPLGLVLDPGAPIAVVGPPAPARALVRSMLVQACVAHGPADLAVAVLADGGRAPAWDWCRWLPHTDDRDGGAILANDPVGAEAVAGVLLAGVPTGGSPASDPALPRTIVVVDDPGALRARRSGARRILRAGTGPDGVVVPIVLVGATDEVPAPCRIVLEVGADGSLRSSGAVDVGCGAVAGVSLPTAASVARDLARLDDPEVDEAGRSLPTAVSLVSLLGAERLTVAGVQARWRAAGADPPPRGVIGVTDEGPLVVDLAADGPHVLVGGTTGSGKSELLRTLVASLAVGSSPDHLTFVLVDFKGGSAFDACARLPHTTGLVTDLDDHLAARALRCLEAELRHRERRLRAVGADDLADLRRRAPGGEPLPRLVVVVDEFATLAAELPDFVDALVDVAQRGRSLGVHLVLATQRPSGSVSASIRANTSLRIALRVQDPADSVDVVDVAGADRLPRRVPGRALVRLGAGELVTTQTALATVATPRGGSGPAPAPVRIAPLAIGRPVGGATGTGASSDPGGATDLALLAETTARAWDGAGGARPRRPWPDPLPTEVAWPLGDDALDLDDDLGAPGGPGERPGPAAGPTGLTIGLADRPDRQRHEPARWHLDHGPLLAVGLPGSGTTTLAATVVLEAASRFSAVRLHVHVLDLGAGDLVPLAGLPHVGAVVTADEAERQRRLIDALAGELARRRSGRGWPDGPRRLLVVDGIGALRARWDRVSSGATWDRLVDVVARGSEVGIHTLVTADGVGAAPHALVGACRQRLVFRLGDPADRGLLGVGGPAADLPPGRAVAAEGSVLVHVTRPPAGLTAAVARLAAVGAPIGSDGPEPVGVLPEIVTDDDLDRARVPTGAGAGRARRADGSLHLTVGLADRGLVPAVLTLPPGGHALVAGPPRSGRTTALAALARAATARGVRVVVVSPVADPWPAGAVRLPVDDDALALALDRAGPVLVLVDDADLTDEAHDVLGRVVRSRRPDRHVVAAGRSDRLRAGYGHWTRELRVGRAGIVLAPDPDLDGDLCGARLPREAPVAPTAGRGWLAGGEPEGYVQVALPGLC